MIKIKQRNIYTIHKRTMHRTPSLVTKLIPVVNQYTGNNMSTRVAIKVKGKAAQELANDNKGKHTHVAEESCIKTNCETKTCASLCDTSKDFSIRGHNTHKPPIGRFCRFVSETDANGEAKPQYFVSTSAKKKNISRKKSCLW